MHAYIHAYIQTNKYIHYVTLHCTTRRDIRLYRITLHFSTLVLALPYLTLLKLVLPYFSKPYFTFLYLTLLYLTVSFTKHLHTYIYRHT